MGRSSIKSYGWPSPHFCQAQPPLNSTQLQLQLRLRLALLPADPATRHPPTHPPGLKFLKHHLHYFTTTI